MSRTNVDLSNREGGSAAATGVDAAAYVDADVDATDVGGDAVVVGANNDARGKLTVNSRVNTIGR